MRCGGQGERGGEGGEGLLKINIVMSSSLFMIITYHSILIDTKEHD